MLFFRHKSRSVHKKILMKPTPEIKLIDTEINNIPLPNKYCSIPHPRPSQACKHNSDKFFHIKRKDSR